MKSSTSKLFTCMLILAYITKYVIAAADNAGVSSLPVVSDNASATSATQPTSSANLPQQPSNTTVQQNSSQPERPGSDSQVKQQVPVLDPKNPHPFGGLVPILECVDFEADGTTVAYFGYNNPNPNEVMVQTGKYNQFTPEPEARSQTVIFSSGRSFPYPVSAFHVRSSQKSYYWQLNGYQVLVDENSNRCRKDWICIYIDLSHPLNVDQQVLARILSSTSIIMGIGENHINLHTAKQSSSLTRIVVNVTRSAENDDSVIDPSESVSRLFRDNNLYSQYITLLRGSSHMNPVLVRPSSTGLEKIGVEVGKPMSIFESNIETNPNSANNNAGNSVVTSNSSGNSNNTYGKNPASPYSSDSNVKNGSMSAFSNNSTSGNNTNYSPGNSKIPTTATPSTSQNGIVLSNSVDANTPITSANTDDPVKSNSAQGITTTTGTTGTTLVASSVAGGFTYGGLKILIASVFANILLQQLCI
ncbi:uncharacterized protein LOC126323927 [Schistocerca gregaria]|uniref:uncharacterized protein LOC126323927 n=1 Tax=Schistocerca gregaria TaxID=7010 RepID=UPI00211E5DD5|nr:uncharacterized protein LOC126323927 [Schistocerca gregaria]